MLHYAVIVGAVVNLAGSSFYISRTLCGLTKPNRVSYFVWALAPMVAFPAALSSGAGWAALPVFMSGFIPFLIFLASFADPKAYWKLSTFDYVCGGLSLTALLLWWLSREASLAILFAILSDAFASWPTIVKAWKFPETEYWSGYAGGLFNAFTGLLAADSFTFTSVAFPIYLMAACGLLLIAIFRKRFRFRMTA